MGEAYAVKPPHSVGLELQVAGRRKRRQRRMAENDRVDAPADQNHHHDRGDLHDAHGLLAGFVDAFDVVPPKIDGHENGKKSGTEARLYLEVWEMNVGEGLVDQANEILPSGYAADR